MWTRHPGARMASLEKGPLLDTILLARTFLEPSFQDLTKPASKLPLLFEESLSD